MPRPGAKKKMCGYLLSMGGAEGVYLTTKVYTGLILLTQHALDHLSNTHPLQPSTTPRQLQMNLRRVSHLISPTGHTPK
jgi:hypothetical protein